MADPDFIAIDDLSEYTYVSVLLLVVKKDYDMLAEVVMGNKTWVGPCSNKKVDFFSEFVPR